jgi:hypothetical protein
VGWPRYEAGPLPRLINSRILRRPARLRMGAAEETVYVCALGVGALPQTPHVAVRMRRTSAVFSATSSVKRGYIPMMTASVGLMLV